VRICTPRFPDYGLCPDFVLGLAEWLWFLLFSGRRMMRRTLLSDVAGQQQILIAFAQNALPRQRQVRLPCQHSGAAELS
jgi:hypothetical protein